MDKLWAPWRIAYIRSLKKEKGCIFCLRAKKKNEYLVLNTKLSIAVLNKYPYNNGHVLIAPIRHVNDISKLKQDEIIDLFQTLNKIKKRLTKLLKPEGYNIGINLGKVAGAGVAGHLHIHIVPRWRADTNFMPVVSDAKVISQSLADLSKKLKRF